MHPYVENASLARKPYLLTTPLTHVCCQSASREPQTKVYIPGISRYLDALLAQVRWLEENVHHSVGTYRPTRGCQLVRALFILGDSRPEKETVTVIKERVEGQDGEDFGWV